MNNILFKGGTATLFMAMAITAGAQDFLPNTSKTPSVVTEVRHDVKPGVRMQSLAEQMNVKSVRLGAPQKQNEVQQEQTVGGSRIATREGGKPGAYYGVQSGVYTLVPRYLLRQNGTSELYANRGVLGYIDRNITFYNQTPDAESFYWDFLGQEGITTDSVTTRPFFVNEGYVETPVLTATANGADSTYQMGNYINGEGKTEKGMVALTGSAFVWNCNVEAEPFFNTGYMPLDSNNPWAAMLFGTDTSGRSAYMEMFDAPAEGGIYMSGTNFLVLTPSTVDLSRKPFTILWAERRNGQFEVIQEMGNVVPTLFQSYPDVQMRLWDVTAAPDDLVKVDSAFYVMIQGPQDGTQWALYAQLDRALYRDSTRNTAWYVPTVGENMGVPLQYILEGYNQEGEVVTSMPLCTSLDIHQLVATPYILLAEGPQQTLLGTDSLNLDINGQTRTLYLSDWYNTAASGQVSITATVSASTDADWLTVTQPGQATGGVSLDYFEFSIQASSLPFDLDGRRATVTLTDSKGFSRDIVIYQGDVEAADNALGVEEVKKAGEAKVVATDEGYQVTYPAGCRSLEVYGMAGQLVASYALSGEGGMVMVPESSWQKGVYVFRLTGEHTQAVKVLK